MSVFFILDFPEATMDQYDRVIERMDLGGEVAPGAVFHVAGPHAGGLRVIDVWDDEDAYNAFAETKIGPLTAAEGIAEPAVTRVEVHRQRDERASGDEIAFLQVVRLPGLDPAAFDEADAQIVTDGMPDGGVFHVAGQDGDDMIVADVWVSKEVRDAFLAEKIMPVMANAPLTGEPVIDDIEVHGTLGARVASKA